MWWFYHEQQSFDWPAAEEVSESPKPPHCPIWVPDVDEPEICAYCADDFDTHTTHAQKLGEAV